MILNLKNLTPACTFYICQYSWAFQYQYLSCVCTQSEQCCSSAEVKKDTARGWPHRGHIWADVDETITRISRMIPAFMHQLVNNCSFHTYKSQTHTHTHIYTQRHLYARTQCPSPSISKPPKAGRVVSLLSFFLGSFNLHPDENHLEA
ncbi:hypothetical protein ATANTOWER_013311 [Ataeniobius toweri]|uniref:Uncharacterized protein n=1 Tax=Ataeniobius toweri TaxID=208326 RepID=A0ABU7B4Q0_9TELE|nr:hypothetical protein [Ataeniobius toweri]